VAKIAALLAQPEEHDGRDDEKFHGKDSSK